jgi:hypothetical protein
MVAWFYYKMLVPRQNLFIRSVVLAGNVRVFEIGPVVDEGTDLHLRSELRHSADMVTMKMSYKDVVDMVQSGGFCGSNNPIGIAALEAGPAGIDQERLT